MAKELPYFKFEPAEWMMGRINRERPEVQISFLRLCCQYWRKTGEMTCEDAILEAGEEEYEILVKKKFILTDDSFIYIDFLSDQLHDMKALSTKRSEVAKKRWENKQADAIGMQKHDLAVQNDADKIREEEKRLDKKREEDPREEKVIQEIVSKFSVRDGSPQHRLVRDLVVKQNALGKLDYLEEQHLYYHKFKEKIDERKHVIKNYIKEWDDYDFKKKYNEANGSNGKHIAKPSGAYQKL